jgi:hypothetical protein
MRTAARSICAAVVAVGLSLTATPAVAKGPTDLTVYGPGVDVYVDLTSRRGTNIGIQTLGDAARLYRHWDGSGLAPAPPLTPDQLGPRYVLTWTVGSSAWAVQHAYPFAEGGAWVQFVPEGTGGWTKAPGLKKQLVELGAVDKSTESAEAQVPALSTAEPEAAPVVGAKDEPGGGTSYDVAVPAGLLLAGVLGIGGVVMWRRRLSR